MSTYAPHHSTPPGGSAEKLRVAIGSAVGTTIENYDFAVYGIASALFFGKVFFAAQTPLIGLLLSFATLAVGFFARPIGGIVAGYLGDRIGRKPVLVASLLVMGVTTVLMGCLPTYHQIGTAAPILLVVVRIVQGLAFGAEWGGAILMTFEHAPWRRKGLYTSIPQAGVPLGNFLGNLVFFASASLPGDWAWRVPFLASAVLIGAGIYIRLRVEESPEFLEVLSTGSVKANPMGAVIKNDWVNILRGIGLRVAETGGYALAITYTASYLQSNNLATRNDTIVALLVGAGAATITCLLWGRWSDRIGRRPVYLLGSGLTLLWAFPLFLVLNTGILSFIIIGYVVSFAVCQTSLAAVEGAWFSEMFPANTRSSGASLAYQISALVSGATAFVAVALYSNFGWVGPATLYALYGAVGFITALLTKDSWAAPERERANRGVDQYNAAHNAERALRGH